jgi:hypothetical protein
MQTTYHTRDPSLEARLYAMAVKTPDGRVHKDGDAAADLAQLDAVEHLVESYLRNEGRELSAYLRQQGREIRLDAVGSADLGDGVLAAIASGGEANVLLANRGFEKRAEAMARGYGLTKDEAMTYILSHEMTHAAGIHSEVKTESTIADYFSHRAAAYEKQASQAPEAMKGDYQKQAQSYRRLAAVAKARAGMGEGKLRGKSKYAKN